MVTKQIVWVAPGGLVPNGFTPGGQIQRPMLAPTASPGELMQQSMCCVWAVAHMLCVCTWLVIATSAWSALTTAAAALLPGPKYLYEDATLAQSRSSS